MSHIQCIYLPLSSLPRTLRHTCTVRLFPVPCPPASARDEESRSDSNEERRSHIHQGPESDFWNKKLACSVTSLFLNGFTVWGKWTSPYHCWSVFRSKAASDQVCPQFLRRQGTRPGPASPTISWMCIWRSPHLRYQSRSRHSSKKFVAFKAVEQSVENATSPDLYSIHLPTWIWELWTQIASIVMSSQSSWPSWDYCALL